MTTLNIRAALERLIELEDAKGPAPAIANAWTDAIADARAALAEPVREPAPLAEGDAGELVEYLRNEADYQYITVKRRSTAEKLTRAADLLEQCHPVPVPVSERLPGPEDCDAEGRCWWFNPGQPAMSNPHIATSSWRLCRMLNGKPMGSHWLPATTLPLP